jgi:ribosome biogenesis GTPase / thiamine phosphate phosphatase
VHLESLEYGANKVDKEQFERGRVSFNANEVYRVLLEGGNVISARPSGVLRTYENLPVIGDWVWVRRTTELSLIEAVEPRRTAFVRKAAGRLFRPQCVAANIDICFVICGLDEDFNLRRIERYLALTFESKARPVIVLNKADLSSNPIGLVNEIKSIASGVDIIALSARYLTEPLWQWLGPGVTAVLLGSSGAGKSTIANGLTGLTLATREVREHDSRGRHTTTAGMLIELAGKAWLVDTPGMRELGLWGSEASLDSVFSEIVGFAKHCRFGDCCHRNEPGCAVRAAVEAGHISPERWESYGKLQREARHHALETNATARRAERQRWKAIHKANRRMYRERDYST